jgi:hypothetical protein
VTPSLLRGVSKSAEELKQSEAEEDDAYDDTSGRRDSQLDG